MTQPEPGHFVVERSIVVDAPPSAVHAHLDDFHRWTAWSPWEGSDPDMNRTYTGASAGVGSAYSWSGNRKAGSGSMTITESGPERVGLDLVFTKPFKATNRTVFDLEQRGESTEVTWRMTGKQNVVFRVLGRVFSMDKIVGKDFEKGLVALKAAAERG